MPDPAYFVVSNTSPLFDLHRIGQLELAGFRVTDQVRANAFHSGREN